jgi:hypothetical protein
MRSQHEVSSSGCCCCCCCWIGGCWGCWGEGLAIWGIRFEGVEGTGTLGGAASKEVEREGEREVVNKERIVSPEKVWKRQRGR